MNGCFGVGTIKAGIADSTMLISSNSFGAEVFTFISHLAVKGFNIFASEIKSFDCENKYL